MILAWAVLVISAGIVLGGVVIYENTKRRTMVETMTYVTAMNVIASALILSGGVLFALSFIALALG